MNQLNRIDMASDSAMRTWLEHILKKHEAEVLYENQWPVSCVGNRCRSMIWSFCHRLDLNYHGIPGQTCHLLEQFYTRFLKRHAHLPQDSDEVVYAIDFLVNKFMLIIAACANLTVKMFGKELNREYASYVICLSTFGYTHSIEEISSMEFLVFKELDYNIPLWTGTDIAQLLAVTIGLPQHRLNYVAIFIDFAEFHRKDISDSLKVTAFGSIYGRATLPILHLAAGAIVAVIKYLRLPNEKFTRKLAVILITPELYIKCVGDLILKHSLGPYLNLRPILK